MQQSRLIALLHTLLQATDLRAVKKQERAVNIHDRWHDHKKQLEAELDKMPVDLAADWRRSYIEEAKNNFYIGAAGALVVIASSNPQSKGDVVKNLVRDVHKVLTRDRVKH